MNEISQALQDRFSLQKEFLGESKPVNNIEPLVSVSVPTYQHAKYISDCLNGIIYQRTSFAFEVIIGEDGSTDGTREICERYAILYQDKIRLFNRDRKLSQFFTDDGSVTRFNGLWNRMSARGKYIAICEGDDYWIDVDKLQKQVSFLESHPEYTLCFHNAKVVFENKDTENNHKSRYGDLFSIVEYRDYSGIEVYENWLIPTASVVFRREILDTEIYQNAVKCGKFRYGDILIFLSCAHYGKIRGFADVMSVYRRLDTGAVINDEKNDNTPALIRHHTEIPLVFGKEYIDPSRCQKTYVYLNAWRNHKRLKYVVKAFNNYPLFFIRLLFRTIKRNMG